MPSSHVNTTTFIIRMMKVVKRALFPISLLLNRKKNLSKVLCDPNQMVAKKFYCLYRYAFAWDHFDKYKAWSQRKPDVNREKKISRVLLEIE